MKLLLNGAINRHYIRDSTMEMIGIPFYRNSERGRERIMQLEHMLISSVIHFVYHNFDHVNYICVLLL